MSPLPPWAHFTGDPYGDEFADWSSTPCARPTCGVVRWAHIANALAAQRGAGPYWVTCAGFQEQSPAGAREPMRPGPTLLVAGRKP